MNFSFCIHKLAVGFYMINEIQGKIKFQNIVQCPFNDLVERAPSVFYLQFQLMFPLTEESMFIMETYIHIDVHNNWLSMPSS